MGMMEPAESRGGHSFDLPQPASEEADQTGWQRHGSGAQRCLGKPGGPACLLSRGGRGPAGGGEAPGDCADTGRKLASKFYQLSAEEVGAGPGSEDGSGGSGLDQHGNASAAPKATPAPCPGQPVTLSTPLPPRSLRLLCSQPQWVCDSWVGVGAEEGQGQGTKVKTGKPAHLSLPHTLETGSPTTSSNPYPITGRSAAVTPIHGGNRTVMCPKSHRLQRAGLRVASGQ